MTRPGYLYHCIFAALGIGAGLMLVASDDPQTADTLLPVFAALLALHIILLSLFWRRLVEPRE
ncbi:hypothetical protein G5C33_00745 [Sphingosinithalassobacter tenebrarum]|uniref:Uncharacterized protein n=1 Tax=Stakelama tenebrarum TaxID=2711215 RepID=A0A6G6Y0J4_9SPHN|nr:hypothetical protein G5C33_00745 [Sphingosinithalassobacter tenebrarum]